MSAGEPKFDNSRDESQLLAALEAKVKEWRDGSDAFEHPHMGALSRLHADELAALLAAPDTEPRCSMCKGTGVMPGHFDIEQYLDDAAPEPYHEFDASFDTAAAPTPRQSVRYCGHEVEVGKACPECYPVPRQSEPELTLMETVENIRKIMAENPGAKEALLVLLGEHSKPVPRQSEPDEIPLTGEMARRIWQDIKSLVTLDCGCIVDGNCVNLCGKHYATWRVSIAAPRQSEPEGLDGTLETNRKLRFALDNARAEFREALAVRDAEIAKLYDKLTSIAAPSATEKGQRFLELSLEMYRHSLGGLFEQRMASFPSAKFHEWCAAGAALGTTEQP